MWTIIPRHPPLITVKFMSSLSTVFAHWSSISCPLIVLFPSMHTLQMEAHWSVKSVRAKGLASFVSLEIHNQNLREQWWFESGDQCADIDGNNGDDDAGQEDGGQFVDVLHTHKDQQGHLEETDGAVDPHVIQHGRPFAFRVLCLKNGCLRCYVHLEEGGRW